MDNTIWVRDFPNRRTARDLNHPDPLARTIFREGIYFSHHEFVQFCTKFCKIRILRSNIIYLDPWPAKKCLIEHLEGCRCGKGRFEFYIDHETQTGP